MDVHIFILTNTTLGKQIAKIWKTVLQSQHIVRALQTYGALRNTTKNRAELLDLESKGLVSEGVFKSLDFLSCDCSLCALRFQSRSNSGH